MIETTYVHPKHEGTILVVDLENGERHIHQGTGYTSYNAGHVIVVEDETSGTRWCEYDKGSSKFKERMARILEFGWVKKC